MERFLPSLGIAAALVLGVTVVGLSSRTVMEKASLVPASASTTSISVVSNVTIPQLTLPTLSPSLSGASTSSSSPQTSSVPAVPEKTTPFAPSPVAPKPSPKPAPKSGAPPVVALPAARQVSEPPPPVVGAASDATASALRSALVNIVCYAPPGAPYHSISGSGIIVSSSGYILTNAHVAQYFLLTDKGVDCSVRTGSPAVDSYTAKLAFISPGWISANAGLLTTPSPTGTGERDFAVLAIDGVTGSAQDAPFANMPLAKTAPAIGAAVVIGSYGAQFLTTMAVQDSLFPTLVYGSVKDVYTFGTDTIDVLDLGGSAAAQEGSSGGGVADGTGHLVGTITTSTVTGDTSTRSLDAITASYIRADYATETGESLDYLLALATSTAVADFASERATLESKLLSAIGH